MVADEERPCPACSAPGFDGDVCKRCGYAAGEKNRCPHCNAIARAEHEGDDVWVCAVCGGPRIPGGHGGDRAAAALVKERRGLVIGRAQSLATIVYALLAAFFTLVALAIMPASLLGKAIVLALAIAPVLLALRSRSKASKARREAREAHAEAWLAAAEEVARRKKEGITASELGKILAIPSKEADRMLTELAKRDRTRIDVDEAAEIRYRVGGGDLLLDEEEDVAGSKEGQKAR